MKAFKRFLTKDSELNRVQSNIAEAFGSLNSDIVNSILIKDVLLTSGDNEVSHKLGRNLQGYIVVKKSANVDIYDKQEQNDRQKTTLVLNSSGSVVVNLLVF